MRFSTSAAVVALATSVSAASPSYLGFNSGSTHADGSAKTQADFEKEFTTAINLVGAPGNFSAMRLYTNIQGGTTKDPLSAFPAAITTGTKLLLGIWCSGTTSIQNELDAITSAISTYGTAFTDLVVGISIGSEDLYRNSVTGVTNDAGIGADPSVIVGFINDFKSAVSGTPLASTPIGHVDTWDAWTNGSNSAVLDAVDWLGLDEYPYYQTGTGNSIENSAALFLKAWDAVKSAAGGKEMWLTETGWPYTGITWDLAVANVSNAKYYWDAVGCAHLFNQVPTFWYTLQEDNAANQQSFSITENYSTTPLFNLTCPAVSSSTSTASSASATGTVASSSGSTGSTGSSTAVSSSAASSGSSSSSTTYSSGSSGSSSSSSASASTTPSGTSAASGLKAAWSFPAALAVVGGLFFLL